MGPFYGTEPLKMRNIKEYLEILKISIDLFPGRSKLLNPG
jgi:hypothetical protein